ncbi:urease accessory protein UreD [Flexivirga caeni]|uniref:Urease accessory protein n=1 Tax=Flexivirga caeni TaxID=2294115 RepID=A0A3M9M868_9MICO|nr:urease accessory protein UreD [Flexivirga caeni]RNI21676.1 urease accessory protein [Flexivirga caeni]
MTARTTRVLARLTADGSVQVELATGLLAPRVVRQHGTTVEIALVATGATLLGGDHLRVELSAQDGTCLVVRDVAGTVAYAGGGRISHWDNEIQVGPSARLVWHAEPLVLSDGAQVHRETHADVAGHGRLLLRDTVVLGRAGQAGGELTCRTRIWHDGRPLLAEDLVLDRHTRALPGVLGARVLDTATAAGWRPEGPPDATVLHLAGEGAMARSIVDEAHHSEIHAVWRQWADQQCASL